MKTISLLRLQARSLYRLTLILCALTFAFSDTWAAYSYSGTGTFNKQESVDGDGYYVFVLTPGAFTSSCSSNQLGVNSSYNGTANSVSNPATTVVMQVSGYTNGKYYIINKDGNYLYSSANKKIEYSSTSTTQYWKTANSKLQTDETTPKYMGYYSTDSYFRAYTSSTSNATSFVCVYKLASASCSNKLNLTKSVSGNGSFF